MINLKAIKTKKGLTLGKSCYNRSHSVNISTSLEGNKNKTGQNWDNTTQNIRDLGIEDSHQAISQFRGNKNGIGAKLGLMPSHVNENALKIFEETGKASQNVEDTFSVQVLQMLQVMNYPG